MVDVGDHQAPVARAGGNQPGGAVQQRGGIGPAGDGQDQRGVVGQPIGPVGDRSRQPVQG